MIDLFNTIAILGFSAVYIGLLGLIIIRLWQNRNQDRIESPRIS